MLVNLKSYHVFDTSVNPISEQNHNAHSYRTDHRVYNIVLIDKQINETQHPSSQKHHNGSANNRQEHEQIPENRPIIPVAQTCLPRIDLKVIPAVRTCYFICESCRLQRCSNGGQSVCTCKAGYNRVLPSLRTLSLGNC